MMQLPDIQRLVMQYATDAPGFSTPASIDDPIDPGPSSMNTAQFNGFFSSLYGFLATHSIQTHIRLEELGTMSTWAELAGILYARQTS